MDAICILKVNDAREKLYKDSEANLNNFTKHFDAIRKTNTYGINEIDKYFSDFIEFERVLYGTDDHYRDHVEHVLQVWAIGISLLRHHSFSMNDDYHISNNIDYNFQLKENRTKTITKSEFWSMWTIISLCHDLGYPIEKTSKINKQAKKIISYFGNINFNELNYSFDIFNTFLLDKYLNIISSKASIPEQITIIQTKYHDKISKSLEDYKHGVFSGLLLFKNLTYFLETDYHLGENELSEEDLRQFFIRKEILRAIAIHTCPKIYHLRFDKLSFLLILCDELQEWNRPTFDDFRKKNLDVVPDVVLKEFEMLKTQKIKVEFSYRFKISEEDKGYIISSKFKHLHNMLRSAKDDKERNILFEWNLIFLDERYTFIFDSSKNVFDQLKIIKQKKEKNSSPKQLNIY